MYTYWIYNWFTGEIDSAKTVFLRFHSTIVLKAGFYHSIAIEPKDCYGNPVAIDQSKLDIEIRKVRVGSLCYYLYLEYVYLNLQSSPEGPLVNPEFFADRDASSKYELYLKVEEAGYYMGRVKYSDQRIGPKWFGLISLTGKN